MFPPSRPLRLWVVVLTTAVVASGCAAAAPPVPPAGFDQHFLTRDGNDVTTVVHRDGLLRMRAPAGNVGINSRTVVHRAGSPRSADHQSCVTAEHSGLPVQEGVALRVSTLGGTTRAVTVTKNIWGGIHWHYNVHTWDTSRGQVFEKLSGHDMGAAITGDAPRRLCARAVGQELEFKVWSTDSVEPPWGDPVASRTVRLPRGWDGPGRPGWYIGHLPPGGWAEYDDMATTGPG